MQSAKFIDVIFDGDCLMCNSFIRYIDSLARYSNIKINAYPSIEVYSQYKFLSPENYAYLEENAKETIITVRPGGDTLLKSRAIEEIFISSNSFGLKIITRLMYCVPYAVKDLIYIIISKIRRNIRLFNKKKCSLQTLKYVHIYNKRK